MGARRPRTESLAQQLDHRFERPELLEEALTHRSTGSQRRGARYSYERLEFLGDRVLSLVIAELLMARFPRETEGDLSRRLAGLVRRDALARVARSIDLGDQLRLCMAEANGRENPAILADACEAVIGALYLDGGLAAASGFIARHWKALIEETPSPPRDAKTALQEWAQGKGRPLPAYRILGQEGPAHVPWFEVEVAVEGLPPARGEGASKRAAEQAATTALLERVDAAPDG